MTVSALIVTLIAALVLLGLVLTIKRGRSEYEGLAQRLSRINSLPGEEAELRVHQMLFNSGVYKCVEASSESEELNQILADGLKRLLARYERIETVAKPKLVIARNLARNAAPHEVIVIGHGLDGTDSEFDLGVFPSNEMVYEFHAGESPDPEFGTYKSVFHLIIAWAETEKPAGTRD